jgi:hypothetical protein
MAFLTGLVTGLATLAACILPVLAITGFHQSTASGAALVGGVFASILVTSVIAIKLEGTAAPEPKATPPALTGDTAVAI